jgi:hypothetical protein
MLGLLVLITAHLAGAVHGASFAGPHMSAVAAVSEHGAGDDDGSHMPDPGHDHESEGHIDHAAARPRMAVQDTADEPHHEGISLITPEATRATDVLAACSHPPRASAGSDGSSTLALHCVWRQTAYPLTG